jgi:hypothetical protein
MVVLDEELLTRLRLWGRAMFVLWATRPNYGR